MPARLDTPLEFAYEVAYNKNDDVYLVGHSETKTNRFGAKDLIELAAIVEPMFCSRQINLVMLGDSDLNYAQEFATVLEDAGYCGALYAHFPHDKGAGDESFPLWGGGTARRVRVGSPVAGPANKVSPDELWRREMERRHQQWEMERRRSPRSNWPVAGPAKAEAGSAKKESFDEFRLRERERLRETGEATDRMGNAEELELLSDGFPRQIEWAMQRNLRFY